MYRENIEAYDLAAIELEARRLRAEATRYAFTTMVAWFRGKRQAGASNQAA